MSLTFYKSNDTIMLMKRSISVFIRIIEFFAVIVLLTSALCFFGLISTKGSAAAETKEASQGKINFTNLIVFAKFSDETEFIDDVYDGLSVRNLIRNTYTVSRYSVANYYRFASNGKVNMQNLYLFSDGESITLSKPRGYYAQKDELNADGYETGERYLRMAELKEDWTQALDNAISSGARPTSFDGKQSYSLGELDKNGDGKIDAITVIYKNTTQNISVGWSDPLWNYQDYVDGYFSFVSDGKTISSNAYLQLTFTYSFGDKNYVYTDEDDCKFLNQSVSAHETGHIFGLKDLYRSASESPIYYMSLMGKHLSPVGQFLSVKERESMGWLDDKQIKTLTEEGTYTVSASTSDISDKVVGYKLDIPGKNKTLYLEYRNFEGKKNIFDNKNKIIYLSDGSRLKGITLKSGLVCYLATTDMKIPNNMGTVGVNWNYEAIGGGSTKNDCALGEGDYVDIPYTNNLFIEVLSVNDDELVFSITGDELNNPSHTHKMTLKESIEPTCTDSGNISYYICETCGKYFSDELGKNEIDKNSVSLPPKGHTAKLIQRVEPTCTDSGLSEGKICEVCGEVLQKQNVLPALGHKIGEWVVDKAPTTSENGLRHKECSVCHEWLEEEVLQKLPPSDNKPDLPKDDDNKQDKPNEDNKGDAPSDNKPDAPNGNKNDGGNVTLIVMLTTAGFIVFCAAIIFVIVIKRKK